MTSSDLYQQLLRKLEINWHGLPDKPDENPFTTLNTLWKYVNHSGDVLTDIDPQSENLDSESAVVLSKLVEERISGTPLAYLVGHQTYLGIDFLASPEAMIPRKETELLGETALDLARQLVCERGRVKSLDLCTGSGNVVLTLAHFVPEFQGVGADISKDAVGLAERNAKHLGLEERVQFFSGDLFEPLNRAEYEHGFDLITCNPPYIATANAEKMADEISHYEPREAFDGGPFGIQCIMHIIREAPRYLKPASWLIFEVGLGQGKSLQRLVTKTSNYQRVEHRTDQSGNIRVLIAQSR